MASLRALQRCDHREQPANDPDRGDSGTSQLSAAGIARPWLEHCHDARSDGVVQDVDTTAQVGRHGSGQEQCFERWSTSMEIIELVQSPPLRRTRILDLRGTSELPSFCYPKRSDRRLAGRVLGEDGCFHIDAFATSLSSQAVTIP